MYIKFKIYKTVFTVKSIVLPFEKRNRITKNIEIIVIGLSGRSLCGNFINLRYMPCS